MINIINNPPIFPVIQSEQPQHVPPVILSGGRKAEVEGSPHSAEILRCAQNDMFSHRQIIPQIRQKRVKIFCKNPVTLSVKPKRIFKLWLNALFFG